MLGWLLGGALGLTLFGLGPRGAAERDKRQHWWWVGAGLVVAGACPNPWLGATLAVIVVSAILTPPLSTSTLALPPIVAWAGVYDLLALRASAAEWRVALLVAGAVVTAGAVWSVVLWCLRTPDDAYHFVWTIKIPWTRYAYTSWSQHPHQNGWFDNPFIAGPAFAGLLPAVAGVAVTGSQWWLLMAAPLLAGMYLTASRGAWIAGLTAAAVYAAFRDHAAAPVIASTLLAPAVIVALVAWWGPTGTQRKAVWGATWDAWRAAPWRVRLLGTGPWGWWLWMADGRPRLGLPAGLFAPRVQSVATPGQCIRHMHNDWAQAAFEHGPLILVTVVGYLGSTWWRLWQSGDPWAPPVAAGLAASAVTCLWSFPVRLADTAALLMLWMVGAATVGG